LLIQVSGISKPTFLAKKSCRTLLSMASLAWGWLIQVTSRRSWRDSNHEYHWSLTNFCVAADGRSAARTSSKGLPGLRFQMTLTSAAKSRQMPSLFKYIWKSGRVTVARAAGKSSVFMRTKLCPRLRNSMTTKSQVMSHLFDIINIICCCYSHILLSFESSPFSRSFFFVCGMCTPDASIAGGWSSLPSQRTRSTVRSYAYSGLGCSLPGEIQGREKRNRNGVY